MAFQNNHSRHKKNFRDHEYPEDTLKIIGHNPETGGIVVQIIRKIDNGGSKLETEITPFTLSLQDVDPLIKAFVKAREGQ